MVYHTVILYLVTGRCGCFVLHVSFDFGDFLYHDPNGQWFKQFLQSFKDQPCLLTLYRVTMATPRGTSGITLHYSSCAILQGMMGNFARNETIIVLYTY